MNDKLKDKNKTITDFTSIFTSDSKLNKNPGDDVDYDEVHLAPINDLFDNKENI